MILTFEPITRDQATECTRWRYEPPYELYNLDEADREIEITEMLKPENKCFAVLTDGEFIGTQSFGVDGRVKGGSYDSHYQDTGGALRPDRTGVGLGERVLRAGLLFGAERFGFMRYRVTVAAFNQRALTVCTRVGFTEKERFLRSSDQSEFVILTLAGIRE